MMMLGQLLFHIVPAGGIQPLLLGFLDELPHLAFPHVVGGQGKLGGFYGVGGGVRVLQMLRTQRHQSRLLTLLSHRLV